MVRLGEGERSNQRCERSNQRYAEMTRGCTSYAVVRVEYGFISHSFIFQVGVSLAREYTVIIQLEGTAQKLLWWNIFNG